MNLKKLLDSNNWEIALITFTKDNWKESYTEIERTYKISSRNKYFQSDKISSSLFGDCLDKKDIGVRLDIYNWKVEKIVIDQ